MNDNLLRIAVAVPLVAGLAACTEGVRDVGQAAKQLDSRPPRASAPPTVPGSRASVDNGVQQLSAREILARAKKAARQAGSVHMIGVVREGNQPVELDVRLQGERGLGLIRSNGTTVRVVKVGSDVYVQGNDAFYEQFSGPETARLLRGKWLRGSSRRPPLAQPAHLLDVDKLLNRTLPSEDEVTKGRETLVGDLRAVELTAATTHSVVTVALTGEPYPLSVEPGGKDTDKGHLRFSEWGEPVRVQAPPADSVVDPAQLRR